MIGYLCWMILDCDFNWDFWEVVYFVMEMVEMVVLFFLSVLVVVVDWVVVMMVFEYVGGFKE